MASKGIYMIETIRLLRNIGMFESVDSGAQLPLNKLALIYGENGRGKTTLSAVLRSLGNGDPLPISERQRLGSANAPHIVVADNNGLTAVFQNDKWAGRFGDFAVFDDQFVTENVCSGMEVEPAHRQNLHELIIGAQGVALNTTLQGHINRIEQHNRDLQAKGNAIPAGARGGLSIDAFCNLDNRDDIDSAIRESEQRLAAVRDADAVRQYGHFVSISLPVFDLVAVEDLLNSGLPDLEAEAEARVQAHLAQIGAGGEAWVGEGMKRIEAASSDRDDKVCPFCAQNLAGSQLIVHYQAYFSAAYSDLRQAIADKIQELNTAHSGEIQAAFERAIRIAAQTQQFWARFTDIPEVAIDTAPIALAWKQAFEAVSSALLAKQASPLEQLQPDSGLREKVDKYHAFRDHVAALSDALVATRPQIDIVKERATAADIAALQSDLSKLKAVEARYSPEIAPLCDDYIQEKTNKAATELLRDTARAALNQYREQVFPAYETAINTYLQRFNAGFRLDRVRSVDLRTGSSCIYYVLINRVAVPLSAGAAGEPSFRNTMSTGDRNTLALAFFFASLDRDPNLNQKVIVLDDPITSLDEHRLQSTIEVLRRLVNNVAQVILLSHSKHFLCDVWQGADITLRSACQIVRGNPGSTLDNWDVNQDCITEHDHRHAKVRDYIRNSVGADQRAVASALRPILESFMRVAYPQWFPPGTLLGPFIYRCRQQVGTANEIMSSTYVEELQALLVYANKFHHDTNAAWQTAIINDHELLDFSQRTLDFTRR